MYKILDKLVIIEFTAFIAGPLVGQIFYQLGADVIRIDPSNSPIDKDRFPIDANDNSYYWAELNKGKKLLNINYRNKSDLKNIIQLIQKHYSDKTIIIVTNISLPSHLSYKALSKIFNDIYYLEIYGSSRNKEVDYTINAQTGIPYINGDYNNPQNNMLPTWDLTTGCIGAVSILSLLTNNKNNDRYIKLSLMDTCLWTLSNLGFLGEHYKKKDSRKSSNNYVYGTFGNKFNTKDNIFVFIICLTTRQWDNLLESLKLKSKINSLEKKLSLNFKLQKHLYYAREELYKIIQKKINDKDYAEISRILEKNNILFSKYESASEFVNSNPNCNLDNPILSMIKHKFMKPYISADIPFQLRNQKRLSNKSYNVIELDKYINSL